MFPWLSLLTFALGSGMTPGPNNTLLMISGANWGLRATMPHLLGVIFGFPAMVFTIAAGAGNLFVSYPTIKVGLRLIAVAWIAYLAWRIALSGSPRANVSHSRPMTFMGAALFQWVNPKAWIMAVSSVSVFTAPDMTATMNSVYLALGFMAAAVPSALIWCLMGTGLSGFLSHGRRAQIFNVVMALLLLASVVPALLT